MEEKYCIKSMLNGEEHNEMVEGYENALARCAELQSEGHKWLNFYKASNPNPYIVGPYEKGED